jgi:hypothetical protein
MANWIACFSGWKVVIKITRCVAPSAALNDDKEPLAR